MLNEKDAGDRPVQEGEKPGTVGEKKNVGPKLPAISMGLK
jgi:hypothetical protein